MTAPDPALARALASLTLQVDRANVVAVYRVFRDHAKQLETELKRATDGAVVGLCGGDPVSKDAAASFGAKIDQLLAVHRAHQRELAIAADHLQAIATSYGYTETEIEGSLKLEPR